MIRERRVGVAAIAEMLAELVVLHVLGSLIMFVAGLLVMVSLVASML
ncbi:hypothetical protein ACX1C1_11655 [Paenibacillus sp. strain BS8-2]